MCEQSLSPIARKITKLKEEGRPDLVKYTKGPAVARALEFIDDSDCIELLDQISSNHAMRTELKRTPSTNEYKIVLGSGGAPLKPCAFTKAIEGKLSLPVEMMATLAEKDLYIFGSTDEFNAADAFDAYSLVIPERILAALYSPPYATDEHDTPIPTGGAAAGAVFGYWLYTCTNLCTDSCTNLCTDSCTDK